jgi:hypothetical protein
VQLLALDAFYDRKSESGPGFAAVDGKKFDSTTRHQTCNSAVREVPTVEYPVQLIAVGRLLRLPALYWKANLQPSKTFPRHASIREVPPARQLDQMVNAKTLPALLQTQVKVLY